MKATKAQEQRLVEVAGRVLTAGTGTGRRVAGAATEQIVGARRSAAGNQRAVEASGQREEGGGEGVLRGHGQEGKRLEETEVAERPQAVHRGGPRDRQA